MPPSKEKSEISQSVWQHALERANLGVWDWDLRTGDCFYSKSWSRMLGYEREELPDSPDLWLMLTHPDDRERAVASGERHLAGLTDTIETELRLRHKDGHWVWVLDRGGVIERDAEGRPVRMVGVQTDVTRQKQAEYSLEQINVRLRMALAASGTGLWHHDIATGRSFWNSQTRTIFGIRSEDDEVENSLWHSFLHPDDKDETERAHWPGKGSDVTAVRYRIVRRDGSIRHIESLLRFIETPDSDGQILGTVRDITEETLRQQELAHAARHDALTGLLNRVAFDRLLADLLTTPDAIPLAILYIDLDYFKALNDFAGHAAGDAALRGVADAFRECVPAGAHVARLGGDEFAVLVPSCEAGDAERIAAGILDAVADAKLGPKADWRRLAASIGIAVVRDATTTPADALASADDACYAAKASGRNRFCRFSADAGTGTAGLNAARMAADTLEALERDRLKLFGQQILPLTGERPHAPLVEVLARLEAADGRLIPPSEFIPAAERFGVASRLDRWIIRTALTRYGAAMARGQLALSFNLSAQTLSDPQLWSFVDGLLVQTGAPAEHICFEITETAAVTSFEAAERFVRSARERRCRVALDDFGAGLSSFEYLRRFPVDSIKVNGSFVASMESSRFDREIVRAIAGIAKGLGYKVVAEWIETPEVAAMLVELGVDYGQGFLLHRPEPLDDIVARQPESRSGPQSPRTDAGGT
jgi:diguanylate cyclase (GGDEF)-like protein/PAS domain S-box-containing protein